LSGSDRQSTARSRQRATTDDADNTDRCELKRRIGEGLPLEQIVTALLLKGRVLSCRTSGNNLARSVSGAAGSSDAEGKAAKDSSERGRSRGSFKSVVQNLFEHDRELATASPSFGGHEQEELGGRGNACLARCSFTQGSNPSTWRNLFVPIV